LVIMTSRSLIRFGVDAELEKGLNLYRGSEALLTKLYWIKPFRTLVTFTLQALLLKPDLWMDLSTPTFNVDNSQLQILIEELKRPSSPYIKVKQRRWIFHMLREVSLYRKKFGISVRRPLDDFESVGWPVDIEDKGDLFRSLSDMSLRADISKFLWEIVNDIVPPDRYCVINFFGAVKSNHSFPIVIEVTEEFFEMLNDRIVSISEKARTTNDNLLPTDLAEIVRVPMRKAIQTTEEESFCTSVAPWKDCTTIQWEE